MDKASLHGLKHSIDEGLKDVLDSAFIALKNESPIGRQVRDIEITDVRHLRYSIIINIKLICSDENISAVCKITQDLNKYRPDNSKQKNEHEILKILHSKLGSGSNNILSPFFYYEKNDFQIMFSEKINGNTIHDILIQELKNTPGKKSNEKLLDYLYSIGKLLKNLQSKTKGPYDEQIIIADIINHIDGQIEKCLNMSILNEKSAGKIQNYVNARADDLGDSPESNLVGSHGDFIPINMLAGNTFGNIVVLDFANYKYSSGTRDVLSFLCALDFLGIKFFTKKQLIQKWKNRFMEGYGGFDQKKPMSKLCYIRENLGYLINLHQIPNRSLMKNIGISFVTRQVIKAINKLIYIEEASSDG